MIPTFWTSSWPVFGFWVSQRLRLQYYLHHINTCHIAQLTVNLRPLWSPVVEAFVSLMERFQGTLWEITFNQLKLVSDSITGGRSSSDQVPGWSQSLNDQSNTASTFQEAEKTWGDSVAHRLVTIRETWNRHLTLAMTMKLPVVSVIG